MDLKITFWGVRGSRPTPGKDTLKYGGNTSCVQIETEERNLIFDGGTGIIALGNKLLEDGAKEGGIKEADIFFSHTHWDHIHGLPFFKPFYRKGYKFRIYGENKEGKSLEEIFKGQMQPPYFPISMDSLASDIEFIPVTPDENIQFPCGLVVRTYALDHPGRCLAYRVEKGNSSAVYATDTETLTGQARDSFLEFIRGTSALIYDTHYTDEEYIKKWGHSTIEEAVRLAKDGNVEQLLLFHHNDSRTDEILSGLESVAKKEFKETRASKEGMVILLGGK